ncbi:aldo/keto reductase family protein [Streptomyces rhizosphaerihabitans]|uniref:aldo/keto reductase family protein n=1 Tax=Streptomyces rhizosphaerihabitans TaxID=1266770 RepID=UPI0021BE4089|nr:aldo/keto reductase family protein [Streptomyces rhizosphaerihabitans]MCT9007410.1 aldo/keto reductase family protein [Streptomyces rhizosphaerihabitans]
MKHRRLGRSGLYVSEIAYGNWITHGGQIDSDAALSCVRAALDCGVTSFDTADGYAFGAGEEILGRALAGERRSSVEIFTKVYWPVGPGPNDRGLSRKHIMETIEVSLRRLGTDYVDLYQAHRFDHGTPLEETMTAFADVVRSGKALYIGVSEWRAEEIRAAQALARELRVPLVSNQSRYSALHRVIEAEVMPACRELGLSQLAFSPLAQGVLTGKYVPGRPPPPASRATDTKGFGGHFMEKVLRDEILGRVQRLLPLAEAAGISLPVLALSWVLHEPNVASAVIGASRPEQITANTAACDVVLDDDLRAAMDAVLAPVALTDPALTTSPHHTP